MRSRRHLPNHPYRKRTVKTFIHTLVKWLKAIHILWWLWRGISWLIELF